MSATCEPTMSKERKLVKNESILANKSLLMKLCVRKSLIINNLFVKLE